MSEKQDLLLEVLSGPLDGAVLTLAADTEWSRAGSGPLAFPWDDELGTPQARFTLDEQGWGLEVCKARHGTYRVNEEGRVKSRVELATEDILKASNTWLLVHEA